jgi:hypothetical protein
LADMIRQEITSLGTMITLAMVLYALGLVRSVVTAFLAKQAGNTVIGAVTRAAGLALELQRQGQEASKALAEGVRYVEQAVPSALAKVGAAGHLVQMVEGQIGVLRAGAPAAPTPAGVAAPPDAVLTPPSMATPDNVRDALSGLPGALAATLGRIGR